MILNFLLTGLVASQLLNETEVPDYTGFQQYSVPRCNKFAILRMNNIEVEPLVNKIVDKYQKNLNNADFALTDLSFAEK